MDRKLEQALAVLEDASNRMADARAAFKEIGIEVGSIYDTKYFGCNSNVFLNSGIVTLSTMAEEEIKSFSADSGIVTIDGFDFFQSKLPVEREDRYA